jgi:hypothetical protein
MKGFIGVWVLHTQLKIAMFHPARFSLQLIFDHSYFNPSLSKSSAISYHSSRKGASSGLVVS